MKILVVGGDGMLGHQLLCGLQHRHDVRVTLRQDHNAYHQFGLFNPDNSYYKIDICDTAALEAVISHFRPKAVINAVGVIKQRDSAKLAIPTIAINALFPHQLAELCEKYLARMVHVSTDCVFSGKKGRYIESDISDAEDLYGKSKHLGEVHDKHCVTLRSSIIGLELTRKASLIEWFLAQKGNIKGYRRAIYSGLTTQEMTRVIELVLMKHPNLYGLWHVSSDPIDKYSLLSMLSQKLNRHDIYLSPDDAFFCDRSLLSNAFQDTVGYSPPTWDQMLDELAEQIKKRNALTKDINSVCNA